MKLSARMLNALRALEKSSALSHTIGQPTKQRLAKYGLAEYLPPTHGESKWDAPMRITPQGRQSLLTRVTR